MLWELLYADDLVIIAKSEEELKENIYAHMHSFRKWKECMEVKGMRVKDTLCIHLCGCKEGAIEKSWKWSCGVCSK